MLSPRKVFQQKHKIKKRKRKKREEMNGESLPFFFLFFWALIAVIRRFRATATRAAAPVKASIFFSLFSFPMGFPSFCVSISASLIPKN